MSVRHLMLVSIASLAMLAVAVTPGSAEPISFNLTGGAGLGPQGNTLTFNESGITLKLTGWGYTYSSPDNAFEKAALGQWSAGVGVCSAADGFSCGSPAHQVENYGPDDWVLFLFSTPVDVQSVVIDPYGSYDRDVRYWVGNVSNPLDLTAKTYANLAGLGFGASVDDLGSIGSGARTVSIGGGVGNALLFGARVGGEGDGYDKFKITGITVTESVPDAGSSLLLLTTGLAALAGIARRRR